eukprot:scaffold8908_cov38-Phaeocystis_antarctica.AAC.1
MGPTCSVLAAALLGGGWCSPFEDELANFNSKIHTVTLNVIQVECRVVSVGVVGCRERAGDGDSDSLTQQTSLLTGYAVARGQASVVSCGRPQRR